MASESAMTPSPSSSSRRRPGPEDKSSRPRCDVRRMGPEGSSFRVGLLHSRGCGDRVVDQDLLHAIAAFRVYVRVKISRLRRAAGSVERVPLWAAAQVLV